MIHHNQRPTWPEHQNCPVSPIYNDFTSANLICNSNCSYLWSTSQNVKDMLKQVINLVSITRYKLETQNKLFAYVWHKNSPPYKYASYLHLPTLSIAPLSNSYPVMHSKSPLSSLITHVTTITHHQTHARTCSTPRPTTFKRVETQNKSFTYLRYKSLHILLFYTVSAVNTNSHHHF